MGIITRWFIKQLMNACGWSFSLMGEITIEAFDNVAIQGILSGMKTVGYALYGVTLIILALKLLVEIMDQKTISIGDIIIRIVVGAAAVEFGVTFMCALYSAFLEFGKNIIAAITFTTDIKFEFTDLLGGAYSILMAIMAGIMLFYLLKNFLALLERFWNFIVVVILLYLFIPGYLTGNDEGIIMWFKSTVAIGMTQVLQILIVVLGMSFFIANGSFTNFCLAIGAAISGSKVDQLLDKWGSSSGGKVGNMARNGMSSAFYAKSFLKGGGSIKP